MPTPAGTGLSRRSFLLRSAGLALSVYGAGQLGAAAGRGGRSPRPAAPGRCSSRSSSPAGSTPSPSSRRRRTRPTTRLRPEAGAAARHGRRRSARTRGCAGTRRRRRSPRCTREGKVSVMPAVGYEHPDQSHFVSRHFYEVGALDPRLGDGLARPLPRPRRLARQPAPGPRARQLARARARHAAACRWPPSTRPADYDFWARDVWGDVDGLMLDASARIGAAHRARRPRDGAGRRAPRCTRARCAPSSRRCGRARTARRRSRRPSPTRRRRSPTSRSGSPALAQMLAMGLPLRCVAITAPGDYDTHANQVETLGEPLKLACDALAAFQRDLEARGLADRVLIHVWSEFGRRAAENSEGTDHGAAGLGMVIGTRAAGRMIGEFPGLDVLDEQRQPARDVRLPRRLRRPARAVARDGGRGHRPRRRAGSRGRSWSSEGAARRRRRSSPRSRSPRRPPRPRRGRPRGCSSPRTSGCSSARASRSGRARSSIQVYNRGEDAHDLAARRVARLGTRVGQDVPGARDEAGRAGRGDLAAEVREVQALVHPARTRVARDAGDAAGPEAHGLAPGGVVVARLGEHARQVARAARRLVRRRSCRERAVSSATSSPVGRNGSATPWPSSTDTAAHSSPSTSATRTAPRGARRESSCARRSICSTSAGPARRTVTSAGAGGGQPLDGAAEPLEETGGGGGAHGRNDPLSTPFPHRANAADARRRPLTRGPRPLTPSGQGRRGLLRRPRRAEKKCSLEHFGQCTATRIGASASSTVIAVRGLPVSGHSNVSRVIRHLLGSCRPEGCWAARARGQVPAGRGGSTRGRARDRRARRRGAAVAPAGIAAIVRARRRVVTFGTGPHGSSRSSGRGRCSAGSARIAARAAAS